MEFGIFSQMHVPPDETEHSRFLREVEVVDRGATPSASSTTGRPSTTSSTHYSHQPAPEVLPELGRGAHASASTSAPRSSTSPRTVNHPARVAERIATLDHLSEGRVEFGTGRGSSSAEWGGFAIPSAAETKPMWRESLEQIPRMWRDEPYAFEGKYFRMPERNVLPKPYSKPNPPMWVACSSPQTFAEAGELGLGALCFTFGTPGRDRAAREGLQGRRSSAARNPVGGFINDNIAVTTNMFCLRRRRRGAPPVLARRRPSTFTRALLPAGSTPIPRPPGLPKTGPMPHARADAARRSRQRLDARRASDRLARGDRRGRSSCTRTIGVDQLIYSPLTMTMDQKHVLRSIETFGKHVLPHFDSDPVHRTTRLREAALQRRQAA